MRDSLNFYGLNNTYNGQHETESSQLCMEIMIDCLELQNIMTQVHKKCAKSILSESQELKRTSNFPIIPSPLITFSLKPFSEMSIK